MKLITFYGSRGLRIVKGENQYVWDDKGKKIPRPSLWSRCGVPRAQEQEGRRVHQKPDG